MQETLRPAQVLHQRDGAGTHGGQGTQPGIPAKYRPSGQLAAEAKQRRACCHAAQEQVDGNVIAPRRGLYDGAAVVRGEFRLRDHGHFAGTVPVVPAAAQAGFAVLPAAPGTLRRPEAVEFRKGHARPPRKANAAAAAMPATAMPARRYICGRSAVGTRGSGGSPYTSGSSSSRKTDPVPPTPSFSFAP